MLEGILGFWAEGGALSPSTLSCLLIPTLECISLLLPRACFLPNILVCADGAIGSGLAEGVTALGQLIPGSISSSPFLGDGGVSAQDGAECSIDLPGN